jgi:hypothetical protein
MGIYQTLYLPANPNAEYNRRGGRWYKRLKGSQEPFAPVEANNQKYVEAYFKDYPMFYPYTTMTKIGGVLAIGILAYAIIKIRKNGFPKI